MYRKIVFLALIICINAVHLNTNLLPPDLPLGHVANIFHESGITFVAPSSRKLEVASSGLGLPLPITHSFGFVSINANEPQVLVRTHSSQPVTHVLHSSPASLHLPNGLQANVRVAVDNHSPQISHGLHVNVHTPDTVQARYVENENHAVHEVNSRTQHFEYKVPLVRTLPHTTYGVPSQTSSQSPSQLPSHVHSDTPSFVPSNGPSFAPSSLPSFAPSNGPAFVPSNGPTFIPSDEPTFAPSDEPTFIPSQDEIDALPVFQNDKFLSPVPHLPKPQTTQSNFEPPAQIIDSIFDPLFDSNRPTTRTNAPVHSTNHPVTRTTTNTFNPSVQATNIPTTQTTLNLNDGNNQYTNRFSLPDGTKVSEQGKLISPRVGWENVIAKQGEYEYVSPEGIPVKVKWIADHEGFRVLN